MKSKGYIYVRIHTSWDQNDVCKLGRTDNLIDRESTYITGEYQRGHFCLAYEMLNLKSEYVENLLKYEFEKYHRQEDGGTEFYDKQIIQLIEPYFDSINLKYKKISIDDMKRTKRICLKDIVKKYISSHMRLLDGHQWEKDLVDTFRNFMLSDNKTGIIMAPTGTGKSFMIRYLSLFEYAHKYKKDVLIMNKKKEIFDDKFICEANKYVDRYKLSIEIINLINSVTLDNQIFNNQTNKNRIYIINNDKFTASPRFNNYTNYAWGNIKLLILDECHWSGANVFNNFLMFMKDHIVDKIIGFSATPVRIAEENKVKTLNVFKDEITNEFNIIYQRGLVDAIKDKDRVPNKWFIIPIKQNGFSNETNKEITIKRLNLIGIKYFLAWLNDFIIKSIKRKGILWFKSINDLENFFKYVNRHKMSYNNLVNIQFIRTHTELNGLSVDDNISVFKSTSSNAILLAVMRATEGFDDPSVDFGFNVYLSESSNPLLDQQKEGRVSRNFENKKVGYYGFLVNKYEQDYEKALIKRLGDWISYINEITKSSIHSKHQNIKHQTKCLTETVDDYMNMMIDKDNIKEINLTDIKTKIYVYMDKLNKTSYIGQIRKHMQKINRLKLKNGEELIDTEKKYIMYAVEHELPDKLDLKDYSYNWIKFLRPDYEELVRQYYNINELKSLKIKNFNDYNEKSKCDIKMPNIELINNGMYNTSDIHFNLQNIFNISKLKKF